MSHTPGPWMLAAIAGKAGRDKLALSGGNHTICNISIYDDRDAADARLIAAAPDLLAALRDCALVINGMWSKTLPPCFAPTLEMVNSINAAIVKAEGHT